jgi:hypothetical protein
MTIAGKAGSVDGTAMPPMIVVCTARTLFNDPFRRARRPTDLPDRRRPQDPVKLSREKDSVFQNIESLVLSARPASTRGAYRDRHEREAGCGGRWGRVRRTRL